MILNNKSIQRKVIQRSQAIIVIELLFINIKKATPSEVLFICLF